MMQKIFFIFIIFLMQVYAVNPLVINIDENFNFIINNEAKYYIDENDTSINQIVQNRENLFKVMDKNDFIIKDNSLWSWIELKNITKKTKNIIIENPHTGVDYMDVFIYDGLNQIAYHKLGDANEPKYRALLYGNSIFHVEMEPKQELKLFIRYNSLGFIKTALILHSPNNFIKSALVSSRTFALIFGILIALIIYNFTLYLSVEDKSFLFYAMYGLANIVTISTTNGFLYELDIGLYGNSLGIIGSISANAMAIFLFLLINSFFELKKYIPWLYKLNLFVISTFLLLTFAYIIAIFFPSNYKAFVYIYNILFTNIVLIVSIILLATTVITVYKKLFGSIYIMIGISVYLIGVNIYILYVKGILPYNFFTNHANALAILGDMIFISLALSKKIHKIKKEDDKNRLIIYEHSRFVSLGNVLAGVLHQIKTPLSYLGSALTYFEAKENMKGEISNDEQKIFTRVKQTNDEINTILQNIYELYATEKNISNYNIKNTVEYTLELLSAQISKNGICINCDINSNITSLGYPNTLNHILIILLENSIQILSERKIDNPTIWIKSEQKDESIFISIIDNGNGIEKQYLQNIFDLYFSKRENGSGIGLALAKNLTENILKGKIEAKNSQNGAIFELIF